ncbi:Probable poly(beta-D-mannuronate) O-acetylase (EC 2.3.1.-) [Methylomonas albis]|uniref:Probable alginate O-acetylase n=1 Tax=Methylomonas albis TaxID=1854563 RepID=A0ABR9D4C5_9GAMM|nr:MBOAT family protein [Methylomonas albis]MBD9356722.1 MBOAT family protein [Methylomonas albis]CAD6879868.1 Probable poly(beta-D-mannuronate) O-acetylase (EC 2.3.1.-) [Methylomonas albis]
MLFNSWLFFVFFPIVTILYFITPFKYRWLVLLASSCVFYMAFVPVYLLILAATIIIDYFAAIQIEQSEGHIRNRWLLISIVFTCLILFFFKYYDFFTWNVNKLAEIFKLDLSIAALHLLLPIGLSFHTFQSLSYVIEVYRGNQKSERHFGIYALYVMFYPQLVAGPIERPQNLLHQFHDEHRFNYNDVVSGLRLMAWGLFKKAVIADRLARFVSPIYDNPEGFDGGLLMVATLFFSFQVYCDFSGYSDMARGAARVMGFKLMLNFDRPYASTSLSEFWRRWHISLSTWLRDYVYEPTAMGLRDRGMYGIVVALLLTFLISGFWHGASWTFVIWGLLHGIGLSLEVVFAKKRKKLSKIIPAFLFKAIMLGLTFSFVNFTYIFFRAESLSDAFIIIKQILMWIFSLDHFSSVFNENDFVSNCLFILFLIVAQYFYVRINLEELFQKCAWWLRMFIYQVAVACIAFWGVWLQGQSFIYFQF